MKTKAERQRESAEAEKRRCIQCSSIVNYQAWQLGNRVCYRCIEQQAEALEKEEQEALQQRRNEFVDYLLEHERRTGFIDFLLKHEQEIRALINKN